MYDFVYHRIDTTIFDMMYFIFIFEVVLIYEVQFILDVVCTFEVFIFTGAGCRPGSES